MLEFLRETYSDCFQWFTQAESTICFHGWLIAKIAYYKISYMRATYSVGQVLQFIS